MRESARRLARAWRVLTPVLGAVVVLALPSATVAQGAPGSSGGTIYPFPNPYMPQTLAPLPELSGNYATPYLYSPSTGQTYADPMYYHALRALEHWDAIQASSRPVLRQSRPASRPSVVRRTDSRQAAPAAASLPARRIPSLQEVIDK